MDINITNPVTTTKIGEVVNGAAAATPNDTDLLPVIDTSVTKKLTLTNLKAFLKTYFDTLYSALTASSFGTFINGLTGKTTPVDADEFVISDSAASNVAKKVTGTNVKAFLKTYFDTIYQAAGTYLTSANITQVITNGVTDKAPSEDAVFDALALKENKIIGEWYSDNSPSNPGDGGVVYMGRLNNNIYETVSTYRPVSLKTNGTWRVCVNALITTALGSSEGVTVELLNITQSITETLTTALAFDKRVSSSGYLYSSLANTIGDEMQVKLTFPTWATNPTAVQIQWFLKQY